MRAVLNPGTGLMPHRACDDPDRLVDDIKRSVAEAHTERIPISVGVTRALLWGRCGDAYAPHTCAKIAYLPGRTHKRGR